MGGPSLNIKIAENQKDNQIYFLKNNLTCEFNIDKFLESKNRIFKNIVNQFCNHKLSGLKKSIIL